MTFDEMISKIGVDKILHFTISGFITALLTIIATLQEGVIEPILITFPFIGLIPVVMFSWFKEAVIDKEFNWKDILASVLGTIPVFIATALGVFFYMQGH